jgi:hypothetical protein
MRKSKKSKFRSVIINKKQYYFYTIKWLDIIGDTGHATEEEMLKLTPAKMVSQAYIYKKDNKSIWTFASYDEKDAQFSDRNVFPIGCILLLKKIKM